MLEVFDWQLTADLIILTQTMRHRVNMKNLLKATIFSLVTVMLPLSGPLSVIAASNSAATNGYRLSPVRTDLTIQPGASKSVTVYIQNASSAAENLQVIINDFQARSDESGNPALLLNGATATQHSLKQFVSVPSPTFSLQPNEQKAVTAVVNIPVGTTSGGYYGAIRFAPVGSNGNKNVNLSASIASLVLVTVPGNLNEQLSIASFGVGQGNGNATSSLFFTNKNLKAIVRFQNGGNVQEQPFGKLLLKKGSNSLATYAVNTDTPPSNVLPNSIRLFNVKINKVGNFGKYKLEGNFGYGSKGQLLTTQATFYVIPATVIIIGALILLLIIILIFALPRLIRAYNRRIIARASRH